MEELGYWFNFFVCLLVNQISNSIGLVVFIFDGFYFGCLLQQVLCQIEVWGKQFIVIDGYDMLECEEEVVQMFVDWQCDVIIFYIWYMSEKVIMLLINLIVMLLVVINCDVVQVCECCVFFEQQEVVFQVVEYLIIQGYCDIVCIIVLMYIFIGQVCLQGYCNVLIKYGIEWDLSWVKYGDLMMICGYELCWELLDEKVCFSVLFFCNDDMVLGVLKVLYQVGLCILQDVLLFGFDDVLSVKWLELGLLMVYLLIDNMIIMVIDQVIKFVNQQLIEMILLFIGMLVFCELVMMGFFFK